MIIKIYHLNICVTIHIILKARKEIILQINPGKNRGLCRGQTWQEITILIINMYLKKKCQTNFESSGIQQQQQPLPLPPPLYKMFNHQF